MIINTITSNHIGRTIEFRYNDKPRHGVVVESGDGWFKLDQLDGTFRTISESKIQGGIYLVGGYTVEVRQPAPHSQVVWTVVHKSTDQRAARKVLAEQSGPARMLDESGLLICGNQ